MNSNKCILKVLSIARYIWHMFPRISTRMYVLILKNDKHMFDINILGPELYYCAVTRIFFPWFVSLPNQMNMNRNKIEISFFLYYILHKSNDKLFVRSYMMELLFYHST
jgi:hypothetical protein